MTTDTIAETPLSHLELPGRDVASFASERIREACDFQRHGNPDASHTFDRRMQAHEIIESMHRQNFEIRKGQGFARQHHAECVFLPGRGKQSRVAAYYLSQLYAAGVPVLHNGAFLFGRCIHTFDIPDLGKIDVGPLGGAALFVDEIHTINHVYSPEDDSEINQFDALKKMGYWSAFGASWPMLVGTRLLDQVDEVWKGVGLFAFDAEPLKIVRNQDYPPTAQVHRWLWNGGNTTKSRVSFLRAVVASEEMGTNHEPKPYCSQALDWGWGQMALMLLDECAPLSIGTGQAGKAFKGAISE